MSFREEVTQMFLKSLEEDPVKAIQGWDFSSTGTPSNGCTEKTYKGVNKLYLKNIEIQRGYGDSRWMTFHQIKEQGYHLKKGSHGAKVEYWMPYDQEMKKWISWKEYESKEHVQNPEEVNYTLRAKYYIVFNAVDIEGIPPFDYEPKYYNIEESDLVQRISQSMGVPIEHFENSASAYYMPTEDKIHLPIKEQFKTQEEYQRTALHELGHATGHENRLGRDMTGAFGSQKYAYEELVAEMTSCFMGEYIKEPLSNDILEHHKGYVQSWCQAIKDDRNILFRAIKDAERASDFIICEAELEQFYEETLKHDKKEMGISEHQESLERKSNMTAREEMRLLAGTSYGGRKEEQACEMER